MSENGEETNREKHREREAERDAKDDRREKEGASMDKDLHRGYRDRDRSNRETDRGINRA